MAMGTSATDSTCCKFCHVFSLHAHEPHNRILLSTDNFVVAPSVAALVPGWLLVVSRHHTLSVGSCGATLRGELKTLVSRLRRATARRNQDFSVAVFEHGPAAAQSSVGCGIDHCHLHVVPLEFSLWLAAHKVDSFPSITWRDVTDLDATAAAFAAGAPYLYVEQDGFARIGTATSIPSQFFRRAIAISLGKQTTFNWRDQPFIDFAQAQAVAAIGRVLETGT